MPSHNGRATHLLLQTAPAHAVAPGHVIKPVGHDSRPDRSSAALGTNQGGRGRPRQEENELRQDSDDTKRTQSETARHNARKKIRQDDCADNGNRSIAPGTERGRDRETHGGGKGQEGGRSTNV